MRFLQLLSFAGLIATSVAYVCIKDPGDFEDLAADAANNAILANWNITPVLYQTNAIVGPYYYSKKAKSISHAELTVDKNDTSVVVITDG